jgi:hypothetical protein
VADEAVLNKVNFKIPQKTLKKYCTIGTKEGLGCSSAMLLQMTDSRERFGF